MNSNKLAPFTKPKDEVLGKWFTSIHGGIVYTGINVNELEDDIQMLLYKQAMSEADLVELCRRLEKTKLAVDDLYEHIERLLPHKTNGSSHGLGLLGQNRLLSMLFNIQYTKISFTGGIEIVRKRVLAILKRREKEAEAKRIETLDKAGIHQQMEINA